MRWTHAGWWRPFRHRKSLCPEIGGGKRQSIPTMRACDARALFLRPIRNGPAAGEERLLAAAVGEQAAVAQEVGGAAPAEPGAKAAGAAVKAVRAAPAEPAAVPRAARAAPARDPAASIQTTPTRITSLPSPAPSFHNFRRR